MQFWYVLRLLRVNVLYAKEYFPFDYLALERACIDMYKTIAVTEPLFCKNTNVAHKRYSEKIWITEKSNE